MTILCCARQANEMREENWHNADNWSIWLYSIGARIKKSTKGKDIKLKLRGKRFLYTLKLKDSDKADKIKQSLPPSKSPFAPPFRTVIVGGNILLCGKLAAGCERRERSVRPRVEICIPEPTLRKLQDGKEEEEYTGLRYSTPQTVGCENLLC